MGATAAAMIAVLLLSYAFAQSTVMQVAAASPAPATPICGMDHMAGMAMAAAPVAHDGAGKAPVHHAGHAACPFCAAAANPPMGAPSILAPIPKSFVLVAFLPYASCGPRGPPTLDPRARGPPLSLIMA